MRKIETLSLERSNFLPLDQNGPLAVKFIDREQNPKNDALMRRQLKGEHIKLLRENPEDRIKERLFLNQVFELLNVSNLSPNEKRTEIQGLIKNKDKRRDVSKRAYLLLGSMFGISDIDITTAKEEEIDDEVKKIEAKIKDYAENADGVIYTLRNGALWNVRSKIEMINEVDNKNNPVDLALILFNPRYHAKAKFEALRKLQLILLAGSIDQRERETQVEERFSEFQEFLDDHIWSKSLRIGEDIPVTLLSTHDKKSMSCASIRTLKEDEKPKDIRIRDGYTKLTTLLCRMFNVGTEDKPINKTVYVTPRQKAKSEKILKLLRKGKENPAVAVDDELGLMVVFEKENDLRNFIDQLPKNAAKAGTYVTFEEIEDKLERKIHNINNPWNSPEVRYFKCFAKLKGMRVELVLHTHETYVESLYMDGVSHREYEARRLFTTGVLKRLFPKEYYDVDFNEHEPISINRVRKESRNKNFHYAAAA